MKIERILFFLLTTLLLAGCATNRKPSVPSASAFPPMPPLPPASTKAVNPLSAPLARLVKSVPKGYHAITITNDAQPFAVGAKPRKLIRTYWLPIEMKSPPLLPIDPPKSPAASVITLPGPRGYGAYIWTEPDPMFFGRYFIVNWDNIPAGRVMSAQISTTVGPLATWQTVHSQMWEDATAYYQLVIFADGVIRMERIMIGS